VTVDPLALGIEVDRATDRLLATVAKLDDAAYRAPSALPGWSRAHVIAHLARNADSYVNLLDWAGTGVETPQYPSATDRDERIAADATRPMAEQLADLREAGERFAARVRDLPAAGWSATIRYFNGAPAVGAHVVWARLREVEVHHVDLAAGYRPADWSDAFTLRLLHEIVANFAELPDGFPIGTTDLAFAGRIGIGTGAFISGPARDLAAWLTGRGTGAALMADSGGRLPPVPTWK
jgi:maleylpyruvate isomerase